MITKSALILCATDAGGARNLAPVAALAQGRGTKVVAFGSPATLALFAEEGVMAVPAPFVDPAIAAAFLSEIKPRAILVGTTLFDATEAHLTQAARKLHIPSVAVLDEWYDYRIRFQDASGGLGRLTDLVCCPDEMACAGAAAEGVPGERLRVTGSPALAALVAQVDTFVRQPPPLPSFLTMLPSSLRIVFLSETMAADYGDAPGLCGPFGPYIGYTEHDVRTYLAQAVSALGRPCRVIEKMHPSTAELPPPPVSLAKGCDWHSVGRLPLWPLLWHADAVVGMRSAALLETVMIGRPALSFQPGRIGADRCTAVRLNLLPSLQDGAALKLWLESALEPEAGRRGPPPAPAFATPMAAANVLSVIDEIVT